MKQQQRRIHWNVEGVYSGEDIFRWYFLIVNKPLEIEKIKYRIFEDLAPIMNLEDLDKNLVPRTGGLHYDLFRIESSRKRFGKPLSEIYRGRWVRDRRLYTRKDSVSLYNIIEREGLV